MRRFLTWDGVTRLGQVLRAELGTHEENGPNAGTCHKYQVVTGGVTGDSWCLDFIMWGMLQIVGAINSVRDVLGIVTGSCEALRRVARNTGRLMPVGTAPQTGDIGIVVNTAQDHGHHAFYIEAGPGENDEMDTLEGNSNDTGGSNGDGAYARSKRWGPDDPCVHSGQNHYELIRVVQEDAS